MIQRGKYDYDRAELLTAEKCAWLNVFRVTVLALGVFRDTLTSLLNLECEHRQTPLWLVPSVCKDWTRKWSLAQCKARCGGSLWERVAAPVTMMSRNDGQKSWKG